MLIMYLMCMMITPLFIHLAQPPTLPQRVQGSKRLPKHPGIMFKIRFDLLYCNLTKSQHGNNALMKAVAYNNAKTLIECNPLQFYSLRGELLDIVEVTLTEWNRSKVQFNDDSPVVITFFKNKRNRMVRHENILKWMSQWSVTHRYKRAQPFMSCHNE